jgi:hypothetical protein
MDMIGRAAYPVRFAFVIASDRGQIGVHAWRDGRIEPALAILCAEDNVKNSLAQRLWHRRWLGSES